MGGFLRFVVVVFTLITVMLIGAVGVSAGSGTFGSSHASQTVHRLLSGHSEDNNGNNDGNGGGGCELKRDHHHHGHATGGHENECDGGDDTD